MAGLTQRKVAVKTVCLFAALYVVTFPVTGSLRGAARAYFDIAIGRYGYVGPGEAIPTYSGALKEVERDYGVRLRWDECNSTAADQAYNKVMRTAFIKRFGYDILEDAYQRAEKRQATWEEFEEAQRADKFGRR